MSNMKKRTLAFLHNVRHTYPDPNDPKSQLETDFDDPETIRKMTEHLENCGFNVLPIEADEYAYEKLFEKRKQIFLAFNFSEGIYGNDRYAHVPAILEMLRIPYTGSTPLTQALVLHKSKMKEVLIANGVPTLPFQLFETGKESLKKSLHFPLIVKPVGQGSSAGITNKSVVNDEPALRRQIAWVIKAFHEPVLVERFLKGREFSVPLIGNPPEVLPIIEPDHSLLPKNYLPFDSLEVKWFFEEESSVNYLRCPADLASSYRKKIESICVDTWNALGIRDWCRIDLKCDMKGNAYVLDVNTPAGLLPPSISTTSYFPRAARAAGIQYEDLLKKLIRTACKRYGLDF